MEHRHRLGQLKLFSLLGPRSRTQVMEYLRRQETRNCASATVVNIVCAISRFVRQVSQERLDIVADDLTQTTASDLDSFVRKARQSGLAPGTINGTLGTLKKLFEYLIEDEQMSHQPVNSRRHRLLVPKTLPKPMAETDVVEFFKVIDYVRDRLLFLLMLRCGLRVSEACTLTWEQIDLEAKTIRINNGKGLKDRIVYLSPDVRQTLTLWRSCKIKGRYLFPGGKKTSAPLTPRTVQRLMARYLRQAGIGRRYTPHCLRHTFATDMLNAEMRPEVLKELMGHHSIDMTLRYAQLYESTKRQEYNKAMERIEQRQTHGEVNDDAERSPAVL